MAACLDRPVPRSKWPFEGLTVECANRDCQHRRTLLQRWKHGSEGVFVQGRWYCCAECSEPAIASLVDDLIHIPDGEPQRAYRIPLGLLLLGRGAITEDQLKEALRIQREGNGERVGQCLLRQGAITHDDVAQALGMQWGCPVFPIQRDPSYLECAARLPLSLLEARRMLPVHYLSGSRLLYVAFSDYLDRTSLYAVERLLGERTVACVITEPGMREAFEQLREFVRPTEILSDLRSPRAIAEKILEHWRTSGAQEMRFARPAGYLWVRLLAAAATWDLLFRLHA